MRLDMSAQAITEHRRGPSRGPRADKPWMLVRMQRPAKISM